MSSSRRFSPGRQRPANGRTQPNCWPGGVEKIGEKVLEEAAEVVEAAAEPGHEGRAHTIREAGDSGLPSAGPVGLTGRSLSEVEAELARRAGVSGIEEKANRNQ